MTGKKGKKPELSSEELKAQIVNVARSHFANFGFSGVSLKDIAAEAKVAGSLINYHFKDKDGLFRACVEPFARSRMESIPRILSEPRNIEEFKLRIELFVEEMQSGLLKDRNCFEIMDREMRSGNPLVVEIFKNTMLNSFNHVVGFFKKAQESGLVNAEQDPMMLATILFTSTCDVIRKEPLARSFFGVTWTDQVYRTRYAQHISDLFSKGAIK